MLHIYDVTSLDNLNELTYKCSLGKANIGDVSLTSKEGRFFVVNSTDEALYFLARAYKIIRTTSYDKGKGHVEYTYTGIAVNGEQLNSENNNDAFIDLIPPYTYYKLPSETFGRIHNVMNSSFGPPSPQYSITTEYHGFDSFYVYFLVKAPSEINARDTRDNGETKNEEFKDQTVNNNYGNIESDNEEPGRVPKTKTPIRDWHNWNI